MLDFYRTAFDLKRETVVAVSLTSEDELHIQVAAKEKVIIDQKVPVNVDSEPKDLSLALKSIQLSLFKDMGVLIPRSSCTVHYNQRFRIISKEKINLEKSEREFLFLPDFEEEILSRVCVN